LRRFPQADVLLLVAKAHRLQLLELLNEVGLVKDSDGGIGLGCGCLLLGLSDLIFGLSDLDLGGGLCV